ncbi:BTAD domain-containing putative transcriptional regulator [Streptomyces sp. NPDC052114]|uniref:AfsR/SARP family transcriptional regulator n=1 Tax=unclassified Streptomyces TaxID=2593676 RepID=UPI003439C0B0
MEFRLLGPVSVAGGSGTVPLGPAKRRSLLAALLLRAGTPVPVDALTEALWDTEPPLHARTVIQGHISRLRALLADAGLDAYGVELATQGRAYALQMPETLLDAHRFEDLVRLAGRQRDPADAALMLREALALWHGPALTGTVPTAPLQAAAAALEETRLVSVEQLAEAYGRLDEHGRAVRLLRAQVVEHPLRETLVAALVSALFRAGRQSEALGLYHRTRRRLADDLGVDPGSALRAAYESVLASSGTDHPAVPPGGRGRVPAAAAVPAVPAVPAAPAVSGRSARRVGQSPVPGGEGRGTRQDGLPRMPRLLPRAPKGFLGRAAELADLDRATADANAPLAVLTGPAGVGKTALAVHWAHHRARLHPDGHLFADLRGHGGAEPAEPHAVLREFLLVLGVPAAHVPTSPDTAAALFRTLVADRRLLVVLDNARDSAQVRPLLPGGVHCTTLVTSRFRPDGLVASDWAVPVPLDVLDERDAVRLLVQGLGPGTADPAAARRVARLCDGLPLALRIAAARLSDRRHWTMAGLAAELADEQQRLALLSAEDTGVAAALHGSVARLREDDVRLLAALGRGLARETDAYAAGALAGIPVAAARAGLDRLSAAHLVQEESPGRYALHDLVRLFARGLDGRDVSQVLAERQRRAAP